MLSKAHAPLPRARTVHPNALLISRFYSAFHARDAEAMAACYSPDVVFHDPVFGELSGPRAGDMWRMLCDRAQDLSVAASDVAADDARGSARWVADYKIGRRQRPVHNVIDARFEFRDGRIARHSDSFSLWKWAGMALGPSGRLVGWTPFVQARIRREARAGLDAFVAKRATPPR